MGALAPLPGGAPADGRVVPRQRVVVGADPLGRVPRVLRAPLRAQTRLAPLQATARSADTPAGRRKLATDELDPLALQDRERHKAQAAAFWTVSLGLTLVLLAAYPPTVVF